MDKRKPGWPAGHAQDQLSNCRQIDPRDQDLPPWRIGDVLARFWAWLAYVPELAPGEARDIWDINPGDLVEISAHVRHRPHAEFLGTARVIAADRRHFKLEDGRVFDVRGWPAFSGRKSPIRARRAGR